MRAFVAVELPQTTILRLQEEIATLRRTHVRASWVRPEHMHLTLRFLGEISEEQKSDFSNRLQRLCADASPMCLTVEGIGAFPTTRRPAVVWAGIRQITGDLVGFQHNIELAACHAGLAPDNKSFHPHVTLARIRDLDGSSALVEAVKVRAQGLPPVFGGEFRAGSVALFESELKPGGPAHTRLEEFCLSCNSCL